MIKSKFNVVVISILMLLVILIIVFTFFKTQSMTHCEYVDFVYASKFEGVIVDKIDNTANHNEHGFKIQTEGGEYYLILTSDLRRGTTSQSNLWNRGSLGDSLFKNENSYLVRLVSPNSEYEHELTFYTSSCD